MGSVFTKLLLNINRAILKRSFCTDLYSASIAGRVATGPRAGKRIVRIGDEMDFEAALRRTLRVRTHQGLPLTKLVFVAFVFYDRRMEFFAVPLVLILNLSDWQSNSNQKFQTEDVLHEFKMVIERVYLTTILFCILRQYKIRDANSVYAAF